MTVPTGHVDSPRTCIRCEASLQIRSRAAEGKAAIHTFACPLCGCPNTVSAVACTAILCLVQCGCGKSLEVTIEPSLAPLVAATEHEQPDEGSRSYAHLTMKRSRVLCPECGQPHFVFGAVQQVV